MGKEIVFMDKTSAREYSDNMKRQGYKMSEPSEQNGGFVVRILSDKGAVHVDKEQSLREALAEKEERLERVGEAAGGGSSGNPFKRAGKSFVSGVHMINSVRRTISPPKGHGMSAMGGKYTPIAYIPATGNPISPNAGMHHRKISHAPTPDQVKAMQEADTERRKVKTNGQD